MDNEVSALSRALAVRTLQLEMEFIYGCLEDEAMDITQGTSAAAFMLFRYAREPPAPTPTHPPPTSVDTDAGGTFCTSGHCSLQMKAGFWKVKPCIAASHMPWLQNMQKVEAL